MSGKTKIDWADSTWNPVTGCLHGCEYCYARRIAERFGMDFAPRLCDPGMEGAAKYDSSEGLDTMLELQKPYIKSGKIQPYPMGFYPTFHRYRLDDYKSKKGRTIFVGFMCDLFGDWVPDEWIQEVFKACEAAPQHRYLFLTKNPDRCVLTDYISQAFCIHKNWWFGQSVTDFSPNGGLPNAASRSSNIFLSIEPLLDDFADYLILDGVRWVIIGAETGKRKDKVVPKKQWIIDIVVECKNQGVPVFMKESLRGIMGGAFLQEFPWNKKRCSDCTREMCIDPQTGIPCPRYKERTDNNASDIQLD